MDKEDFWAAVNAIVMLGNHGMSKTSSYTSIWFNCKLGYMMRLMFLDEFHNVVFVTYISGDNEEKYVTHHVTSNYPNLQVNRTPQGVQIRPTTFDMTEFYNAMVELLDMYSET